MSFTLLIPLKEEMGGERRPKDKVKTGLLYGYLYEMHHPFSFPSFAAASAACWWYYYYYYYYFGVL
jgi:hypothetical protein